MNTTKEASSSAFEQINKNLINNIRGERYMQCLGIYCWMKANAVYTDEYELHLGGNKSVTLKKGEISHSLSTFADIWKVSYNTASAIIREMVELGMIEIVGKVKGNTCGNRYVYKVKDFFCNTDKELSNFENKLSNFENKLSKNENKLSNFENKLSKNESKLSKFDHNNNTNNNTENNTKEKEEKTSDTSSTFPASADVTNESQSMSLDDKSMTINKTNGTTMTKEDLDLIEALSDDPMFNECPVEASMRKSNDYEELDDNAYYDKYGKNKPLTNDYEKARSSQIFSELFQYESILKQQGKRLDEEALKLFKNKCTLKPSIDEIKKAAKSIHSMQNTLSMKRKAS